MVDLDPVTANTISTLIPISSNPNEQQYIVGLMAFVTTIIDWPAWSIIPVQTGPVRMGIGFYKGERLTNAWPGTFANLSYLYALDTGELFEYPYGSTTTTRTFWEQYGFYTGVSLPEPPSPAETASYVTPVLGNNNRIQITDQGYPIMVRNPFNTVEGKTATYSRCPQAYIDIDLCEQRDDVRNESPTAYRCSPGDLCRPYAYGKVSGEKGIVSYLSPLVNCKGSVHYVIIPSDYGTLGGTWLAGEDMQWPAKILYENKRPTPGVRWYRLAPNLYVGGLSLEDEGRFSTPAEVPIWVEIFIVDLNTGGWRTLLPHVPGLRYKPVGVFNGQFYYAVFETPYPNNEALHRMEASGFSQLIYDKLYPNDRPPGLPNCYRSLGATKQVFKDLRTTTTLAYQPVQGEYRVMPVLGGMAGVGWASTDSLLNHYNRTSDNVPL